jgi:hypothetical protein
MPTAMPAPSHTIMAGVACRGAGKNVYRVRGSYVLLESLQHVAAHIIGHFETADAAIDGRGSRCSGCGSSGDRDSAPAFARPCGVSASAGDGVAVRGRWSWPRAGAVGGAASSFGADSGAGPRSIRMSGDCDPGTRVFRWGRAPFGFDKNPIEFAGRKRELHGTVG